MAIDNPKVTLGGVRYRLVYSPLIPYQTETTQKFTFFTFFNFSNEINFYLKRPIEAYNYLEFISQNS